MDALVATGLRKRYGDRLALAGVDLTVPGGSLYGFLGPNGAGKTTTLRVAMGLLHADGGTMRVLGQDPWRDGHRLRADVGFLPTDPGLPMRMRGIQALEYFTSLDRRPPVLRRAACDALRLSGDDLDRPIRTYSRGMRQKLAIVQAVQHDPSLLVLDEPTEGLDPLVQDGFFGFLRERRAAGTTVFFSSHILSEVEALCDRVAIIREGLIVDEGRVDDLRGRRPKRVTVVLRNPAAPVAIAGATVLERSDALVTMDYRGAAGDLLDALARLPVDDVRIEEPGLDEIFLSYYHAADGDAAS
jgi:ABC-2 type transport system ATP-binding protein